MARKHKNAAKRDGVEPIDSYTLESDVLDLGSWFILRMTSSDTLKVIRALTARGFSVWSPVERKIGRMPRTRAKYDREVALMPSYAFAKVDCLTDLLKLAMIPTPDVPRFTVFHHKGGIPLVADDQLAALRHEESRLWGVFERLWRKTAKGPVFAPGMAVQTPEGPFAGLSGIVEGTQGNCTLVSFAGFHAPIKIASLLLLPDALSAESQAAMEAA